MDLKTKIFEDLKNAGYKDVSQDKFSDDSANWIDLSKRKGKEKMTIHFSFNKKGTKLIGMEIWESDIIEIEENDKKIFN